MLTNRKNTSLLKEKFMEKHQNSLLKLTNLMKKPEKKETMLNLK